MASVKYQLEELKKPNPRIVLELHTIRGMIQEVDNMDKGLKGVIHRTQMPPGGVPSAPKRKPPTRRNGSKREKGVEAPTAAHSVAPTPSSSKPADAKGGGKRVRSNDDDTASDAPRLGVSSAPSPKRVKTK